MQVAKRRNVKRRPGRRNGISKPAQRFDAGPESFGNLPFGLEILGGADSQFPVPCRVGLKIAPVAVLFDFRQRSQYERRIGSTSRRNSRMREPQNRLVGFLAFENSFAANRPIRSLE